MEICSRAVKFPQAVGQVCSIEYGQVRLAREICVFLRGRPPLVDAALLFIIAAELITGRKQLEARYEVVLIDQSAAAESEFRMQNFR